MWILSILVGKMHELPANRTVPQYSLFTLNRPRIYIVYGSVGNWLYWPSLIVGSLNQPMIGLQLVWAWFSKPTNDKNHIGEFCILNSMVFLFDNIFGIEGGT